MGPILDRSQTASFLPSAASPLHLKSHLTSLFLPCAGLNSTKEQPILQAVSLLIQPDPRKVCSQKSTQRCDAAQTTPDSRIIVQHRNIRRLSG